MRLMFFVFYCFVGFGVYFSAHHKHSQDKTTAVIAAVMWPSVLGEVLLDNAVNHEGQCR